MKGNVIRTIVAIAAIGFSGCNKDDDQPATTTPLPTTQTKNFVAEPAVTGNHFAFFSLERNEEVPYTDSATTKWDIAIRSTTILTNAGTSGPGSGGAYVQRATAFDSFTSIPADSAFRSDAAATASFAIPTGSGNGWYNYNAVTNVIVPIPGNIIVVRTATGKYAKLEIVSYYKDAPATPTATDVARYYTFRFVYQPDGTKKF